MCRGRMKVCEVILSESKDVGQLKKIAVLCFIKLGFHQYICKAFHLYFCNKAQPN